MPIGAWLLSFLAFFLEIAVLVSIIRGRHFHRFPLVLILSIFGIAELVSSAAVTVVSGYGTRTYSLVYWTEDIVSHGLIILLLLALTADALRVSGQRRGFVIVLAFAVLVFGFGSLVVYYTPNELGWLTPLSRNLSFCEVVLNFVLWGALIQSRQRDMLLLLVSAGIGLQVTGEVIGYTLRIYATSPAIAWLPALIVVGSEMLCPVIWFYAFWTARAHAENSHAGHVSPAG